MTNASASMTASHDGRMVARHQGLIEALASLGGFALALSMWYGLNMVMKLSALNVTALIAD